ncbi:RF-1 domain-containing protein [Phellopilus nigrolimitatus]|nr:RF-1 domain-containing protein [Phellopilus nigrolimitatus]
MSVSSELRASARATYRTLFRAAGNTFKGDDRLLSAFREKVRTEFREGRTQSDPAAYAARVQLGREIADVLRRNVVQGMKVDTPLAAPAPEVQAREGDEGSMVQDEQGVWRLRITEHTELGSNDSVKSAPSPSELRRAGKRQTCCGGGAAGAASSVATRSVSTLSESIVNDDSDTSEEREANVKSEGTVSSPDSLRKQNFSALKRSHQRRVKPELSESDLEESFVRGSGPGGQSINKTQNNVQLLHKPTGIRVSCQETRSLTQNRTIARKILLERLDHIANPGLSKEDMKRAKQVERDRRRRKKAKKKSLSQSSNSNDEKAMTRLRSSSDAEHS